jgi:hypothetical protein
MEAENPSETSVTTCPLTLRHIAEELNLKLWFIILRISRLSLLSMEISCSRLGNFMLSLIPQTILLDNALEKVMSASSEIHHVILFN